MTQKLKVGAKITACVYGRNITGTITSLGRTGSVVFARMDSTGQTRWFGRDSVELI